MCIMYCKLITRESILLMGFSVRLDWYCADSLRWIDFNSVIPVNVDRIFRALSMFILKMRERYVFKNTSIF